MNDRAMQALYLLALDPIAETTADPNSYGFRKERSTADAIGQCHIVLSNRGGARWIFEGDIKSCFDRISHEWLLAHIPMDKTILQKWLKAGFMEKQVLHATEEGTPQGGICSPVLANLTLDGLERRLRERYPKATALSRKAKVNLVRYADDFIITGSSQELLENEVKPLVESFLSERGLELSAEKTQITQIEDGFDFLGQNVRDYGGTILVKPSRKNVATFLAKVRGIIKASRQATAGHLIVQLNPVIRGWANYHRHVSSKRTFTQVDHAIFRALWQWAKRRHPKKPRRWVKDKYFGTIGGRHWVFHGTVVGREGVIRPGPALRRLEHADPTAYQGQRGSESLRPRLGTVLRGTPGREDGRDPGGPLDSASALEGARRDLSGLQPEDHHGDGVAQPPHPVANPRGQRHDREPRARASELPPADP